MEAFVLLITACRHHIVQFTPFTGVYNDCDAMDYSTAYLQLLWQAKKGRRQPKTTAARDDTWASSSHRDAAESKARK